MSEPTPEQVDKYLEEGAHCPSCGSSDIEDNDMTVDGTAAWQNMSCTECAFSWTDVYRLEGILDEDGNEIKGSE